MAIDFTSIALNEQKRRAAAAAAANLTAVAANPLAPEATQKSAPDIQALTKAVVELSQASATDALASAFGSTPANLQMYSNTAALLAGVIRSASQLDMKTLKPESIAEIARLVVSRVASDTSQTDKGVPFNPPAVHTVCAKLAKGIYDVAKSPAPKLWNLPQSEAVPAAIQALIQTLPLPAPTAINADSKSTGWVVHSWVPGNSDHLRPTLIVSCDDNAFVVTRGSVDAIDWATNFCYSEQQITHSQSVSYSVHAGFYASAQALIKVMKSFDWSKFKRVWITGHSLGGAISTLACYGMNACDPESKYDANSRFQCVSFGGPACGSVEFCERLKDIATVYVHGDDCVPRTGVIRHLVNAAKTHAVEHANGGSDSALHVTVMQHSSSNQFFLAGRCVHLTTTGTKLLRSRDSFRSFQWSTNLTEHHKMVHYLNCFLEK